jgi:uncharacterized membrane protein
MPKSKKRNVKLSKSSDTCSCGCCKWHSSKVLKALLGVLFILIVVSFAASLIYKTNNTFNISIYSFLGIVFLIVFIGWIFGFFCTCQGVHWSRHGYESFDKSLSALRKRYANGEITKSQYDSMRKDLMA